jgi:hypothetical protein
MKQSRWYLLASVLTLVLAVIAVGQVKKQDSPFEKYRQSSVNELEFRKAKFDVASVRLSIQPTPLPNGLGAPFIQGETAEGKLIIEVTVYSGDLPQTVDGRKDAMMEAVGVSRAAFGYAFTTPDMIKFFDKWTVIQFSDTEKFLKHKGKEPVDPYIGFYENGELVLR